MGGPRLPEVVKPFVAVLGVDEARLVDARAAVETVLGPVDLCCAVWPFRATTYYDTEMGAGLLRQFWAFDTLTSPDGLAEWKLATNAVETRFAGAGGRTVNLDPGYVNSAHVALASTKAFSHRLHMHDGIHAEVTLLWQYGDFVTLPWTFPEYHTTPVLAFLTQVRRRYQEQWRAAGSSSR